MNTAPTTTHPENDDYHDFVRRDIGDIVGVKTSNGILLAKVLWYELPYRQYVLKTALGTIWRNDPDNLVDITDENLIKSASKIRINTSCLGPFRRFIKNKDFGVPLTTEQRQEIENLFTSMYVENMNNDQLQKEGDWRIKT